MKKKKKPLKERLAEKEAKRKAELEEKRRQVMNDKVAVNEKNIEQQQQMFKVQSLVTT